MSKYKQALTENPLAAPNVLGINSGAVFFAVVAAPMQNVLPPVSIEWAAFAGATFFLLPYIFWAPSEGTGLLRLKSF
jgi:iron complex transport system permease protein